MNENQNESRLGRKKTVRHPTRPDFAESRNQEHGLLSPLGFGPLRTSLPTVETVLFSNVPAGLNRHQAGEHACAFKEMCRAPRPVRLCSRMVAADVRRRILARKTIRLASVV